MNAGSLFGWMMVAVIALPADDASGQLQAGAAVADLSPQSFPAPVNGSMAGRFADGIVDPMQARCLAVGNADHAMVFCVVDSCMIPLEICEQAKERVVAATGLPREGLLISATHTHSAAAMTAVFQSEPDPEYVAGLPERIAAAMIEAWRNRKDAEVGVAFGSDPTQVFNRRWLVREGEHYENPFTGTSDRTWMNPGSGNDQVSTPEGPVDPTVAVLGFRSLDTGRPIGLLANYSLHYVGGQRPISADYFGAFCEVMESRLGKGDESFVALLSNGASGNINNINYGLPRLSLRSRTQPGQRMQEVAESVASAALQAWESIEWRSEVALASQEQRLRLGVRKASADELEQARKWLSETAPGADGNHRSRRLIYARESVLLAEYPDQVEIPLQVHRLGDLTIATLPCEVFVEIGLELRRISPTSRLFTISLANGYNGYLPTREAHRNGGYETWRARSSYLEEGAAKKAIDRLQRMMDSL